MHEPKGEMTEKSLVQVAEIFLSGGDWNSQKRFYYDPTNKRRFYKVDCVSEKWNTVLEYEGPRHYDNVWKLQRDEERRNYFENKGMTFLRWPFYCQLTEDVARHFFKSTFSKIKYSEAIKLVYGASEENGILSPGFHTTKNTPANFVARGERRFLAELRYLPVSLKHQVVHSLSLYIRDVGDRYLVITESAAMGRLLKLDIDEKYLYPYFTREPPS
jgi:hypothetical protein